MNQSRPTKDIINWIQLINWSIASCLTIVFIFILNSPNWYIVIKFGFVLQFILITIHFIEIRKSLLLKWMLFDTIGIVLIAIMELENNGIIKLAKGEDGIQISLVTILLINVMFIFTLRFILKNFSKKQ